MKRFSPPSKIKDKLVSSYINIQEKYKQVKHAYIKDKDIFYKKLKEKKIKFKNLSLQIKPKDWIPYIQDYVEKAFKNDLKSCILI